MFLLLLQFIDVIVSFKLKQAGVLLANGLPEIVSSEHAFLYLQPIDVLVELNVWHVLFHFIYLLLKKSCPLEMFLDD